MHYQHTTCQYYRPYNISDASYQSQKQLHLQINSSVSAYHGLSCCSNSRMLTSKTGTVHLQSVYMKLPSGNLRPVHCPSWGMEEGSMIQPYACQQGTWVLGCTSGTGGMEGEKERPCIIWRLLGEAACFHLYSTNIKTFQAKGRKISLGSSVQI